jgi:hypothetical protein
MNNESKKEADFFYLRKFGLPLHFRCQQPLPGITVYVRIGCKKNLKKVGNSR